MGPAHPLPHVCLLAAGSLPSPSLSSSPTLTELLQGSLCSPPPQLISSRPLSYWHLAEGPSMTPLVAPAFDSFWVPIMVQSATAHPLQGFVREGSGSASPAGSLLQPSVRGKACSSEG